VRFFLLSITLLFCGCANVVQSTNRLDASLSEALGMYSAPYLSGSPRPSGCTTEKCKTLDQFEEIAYQKARNKEITYVRLVNAFYEARQMVYPNTNDGQFLYEIQAFQRALAEQLDAQRITEAQWAYLIEKKVGELNERSRTGRSTCNTTNIGTIYVPNYQTICR
jgi:hypothetical protein